MMKLVQSDDFIEKSKENEEFEKISTFNERRKVVLNIEQNETKKFHFMYITLRFTRIYR